MSKVSQKNRDLKYFRIIHLREYLMNDYKFSGSFANEILMNYFCCSEAAILKAIYSKGQIDSTIKYVYLHHDKKWIDSYVKEHFYKKAKQDKISSGQLKLLT